MGNAGICYLWYCSYLSHVMNSLKVCNILLQDWYFFAKSSTTNSHVNMRWYHCSNYYTITSQCQNQLFMVLQQLMLESCIYTNSILQWWHLQQYLIPTFLTSGKGPRKYGLDRGKKFWTKIEIPVFLPYSKITKKIIGTK